MLLWYCTYITTTTLLTLVQIISRRRSPTNANHHLTMLQRRFSYNGLVLLLVGVILFATKTTSAYDFDQGILQRVLERLEMVMTVPVQAVEILETFHRNQGFRPHGIHAAGRDQVLTYLFSLIASFDNLRLYLGTEQGEYFAYFDSEAVYREPGTRGIYRRIRKCNSTTIFASTEMMEVKKIAP